MSDLANHLIEEMDVEIRPTWKVYNHYRLERNRHVIYISHYDKMPIARLFQEYLQRFAKENAGLYHELGHALYNELEVYDDDEAWDVFGDFDRPYLTWHMLLAAAMSPPVEGYLTPYAATHPFEDFADCVAFYLLSGGEIPKSVKNKGIRKKLNYVKRAINNYLRGA